MHPALRVAQPVIAALALCSLPRPASAQQWLEGGQKVIESWPGDCSTPVTFRNETHTDLCDMWVEIEGDDKNNPPELGRIVVSGVGATVSWNVDDNEDKDDDDGAAEDDQIDSTPDGNPAGEHRTQAVADSDCIPHLGMFTLTLCDKSGGSVKGRKVAIFPTKHASDPSKSGGDGGVCIHTQRSLSEQGPATVLSLPHGVHPASELPQAALSLANTGSSPIARLTFAPLQSDVQVLGANVLLPGATWFGFQGPVADLQPPLFPGQSLELHLILSGATLQGPSTDVRISTPSYQPLAYCQAKLNSVGCLPALDYSGHPSATLQQPFAIACMQVVNNRFGLLLYGHAPSAMPFQGGILCVASPVKRTPSQLSGGSPQGSDCSGSFAMDFNAWIRSGIDPALAAGAEVCAQYWYRDPPAPFGTGLSAALRFVIDV